MDITRTSDGSIAEHAGGSPLNVAVTMARQGIDTTVATQVGDDRLGRIIRDHLDRSGVTLAEVGRARPTGSATATLDSGGAATYEFDLLWDPEQLPDPSGFDVVHVGSLGAWMGPGATVVADLARRAHASGQALSFDPNVRPALAPPTHVLRERVLDLVAHSRFVKLSDEDAAGLTDETGDPRSVLRDLAGRGPVLAALTRGGESTLLCSADQWVEVPSPPVDVIDTIGAGDTWMGALVAELLLRGWIDRTSFDSRELRELGEVAGTAAAVTVSRPGADPPWRGEQTPD